MISEPLDQELFHVARSLCEIAAAMYHLGKGGEAACLLQQASDLLTERAKHLGAQRSGGQLVELQ